MNKFEVVEADSKENTITLDAGDYFNKGNVIELGEELFLPEAKPNFPINKYEEDLAKASEILNKAHLPKIIDIAVNAIDDAIMDIDMEAEQEWHAKITLESSLIEIAEQIENQPKLSIPKKIADSLKKVAKAHQVVYSVNGDVFGILEAADWLSNFANEERENVMNPELFDYLNQDKSGHIETCIAFINPLTRPFVEVEG